MSEEMTLEYETGCNQENPEELSDGYHSVDGEVAKQSLIGPVIAVNQNPIKLEADLEESKEALSQKQEV